MTAQLNGDYANIERAGSALSHLDPTDRDVWVRAAMCIKDGFGDAGFEMWDDWGSQCDSHTPSAAKSVWRSVKVNGKTTIASLFYDAKQQGWADDVKYKKPTKAEIDARNAKAAERAKQLAAEEAAAHAAAAKWAQRLWDAATPCTTHPYLERKGVPAHGLRVGRWERVSGETGEVFTVSTDALLVPISDRTRKIWSLQAIFPNKQSNGRDKDYLAGGAKSGNFHGIGKPQQREGRPVFILAEGYATGASVHEATGHMVLVCFDKSGLMPVARSLRERQPDALIVIAADNDTHTEGNPGLTAATKVAKEVGGLVAVPPPGDFNDLHLSSNPEAVAELIEEAFHDDPQLAWKLEREPTIQCAAVTNEPIRDDARRSQQQQENQHIQALHVGEMIPSSLSLEEMLERCVLIASGGHVAYVTEERTMSLSIKDFSTLTAASHTCIEEQTQYGTSRKKTQTVELWKKNKRRKDAMSVTFRAGAPIFTSNPQGEKCVNTWRPIKRCSSQFDIAALHEHLEYLFPDATEREAFLDWLAHIEQKPGELPHYGWLHIAEKTGTGRNWLASLLSRVFRGYVAPNVDLPALLDSSFNSELGGRVLAIVDEIREGASEGSYRHAERLKSMINAETRTINNKYGLKYTEVNACRWLIFSNHRNALPLKDSDRRFRVVMHSADPRPAQVYECLYALLNEPQFINAVGMFLRKRDISHFKPGERPPMNAAKQAAIVASKSLLVQSAEDVVKIWPTDIITYKDAFELLCADTQATSTTTTASLRHAMEDAEASPWERNGVRRVKINGSPQRLWILRNHSKWQTKTAEEVRTEVLRAKMSANRNVSAVFADEAELYAGRNDPPI